METELRKTLSLFDSTCIIVGIIIGAGIYETAPIAAGAMGNGIGTIAIWIAGGLLALAGAVSYAELATAYPKQGGDYVYLSKAYGPGTGFLFAWTQLVIIRPGDIVLMAFVFGRYASRLYPLPIGIAGYASLAVITLSAINIIGVRQAKWTQNILTVIKVLGLAAIAAIGLLAKPRALPPENLVRADIDVPLALILVLFTFGGWNEMAYVAAEVKNAHKNIVRALLWGTGTVTALYVLVNISFLQALGYSGTVNSQAVAVDTVATVFPGLAGRVIGVMICISSLGAVNGLIFTGARISYAMGSEHPLFGLLGKWNHRLGTPVWALAVQSGIGLVIILFAGSFINTIFYTAPLVWTFFLATGLSVWVLRRKEPQVERRFKVPFFPLPTLIFCAASAMMLYSTAAYAIHNRPRGFVIGIVSAAAGAAIYRLTRKKGC